MQLPSHLIRVVRFREPPLIAEMTTLSTGHFHTAETTRSWSAISWNPISRSLKRRSTIKPFVKTNVCSTISVRVDLSFAAGGASMESRTPSDSVRCGPLASDSGHEETLSACESQSRDSFVPPRAAEKPPLPAMLCWNAALPAPFVTVENVFPTHVGRPRPTDPMFLVTFFAAAWRP